MSEPIDAISESLQHYWDVRRDVPPQEQNRCFIPHWCVSEPVALSFDIRGDQATAALLKYDSQGLIRMPLHDEFLPEEVDDMFTEGFLGEVAVALEPYGFSLDGHRLAA